MVVGIHDDLKIFVRVFWWANVLIRPKVALLSLSCILCMVINVRLYLLCCSVSYPVSMIILVIIVSNTAHSDIIKSYQIL